MILTGSHSPYTERQARGFRLFWPGSFTPSANTFVDRSWHAPYSSIGIRLTGANGAAIRTGRKAHQVVPFDGQIIGYRIIGNAVGSIVFDIYRTSFASFPPVAGNTIAPLASAKPRLNGLQASQDFTLHGWLPTLVKDDVLSYRVLSCTGISNVTLSLLIARNNQP